MAGGGTDDRFLSSVNQPTLLWVRDKCPPIARILAYTILPDRAATGCPLGGGALADSVAGMRSGPRGYPGRGSDWGFTAVHFYVARLPPAATIESPQA